MPRAVVTYERGLLRRQVDLALFGLHDSDEFAKFASLLFSFLLVLHNGRCRVLLESVDHFLLPPEVRVQTGNFGNFFGNMKIQQLGCCKNFLTGVTKKAHAP